MFSQESFARNARQNCTLYTFVVLYKITINEYFIMLEIKDSPNEDEFASTPLRFLSMYVLTKIAQLI